MGPKTGGFPHLFTALDHIKDPFIFGSHEQQRDDYHREPHQRKQRWVKIACLPRNRHGLPLNMKELIVGSTAKKHTALKLNKTSLKKKHKSHQNVSFRIPKRSHPFSQTALEAAILVSRAPAKGAGHLGCILSSQDLAYFEIANVTSTLDHVTPCYSSILVGPIILQMPVLNLPNPDFWGVFTDGMG